MYYFLVNKTKQTHHVQSWRRAVVVTLRIAVAVIRDPLPPDRVGTSPR